MADSRNRSVSTKRNPVSSQGKAGYGWLPFILVGALIISSSIGLGMSAQAWADQQTFVNSQGVVTQFADNVPPVDVPAVAAEEEPAAPPVVVPLKETEVSVAPLYGDLKEITNWIITIVGGIVILWVRHWLKISNDSTLNTALHAALERGAAIAANEVAAAAQRVGPQTIDVKNKIAAYAAQYAIDHRKEAVDRFGLSKDALTKLAQAYVPVPPTPAT